MAWSRFTLAGARGRALSADAVRYGPGIASENELRLLGHVEGRRILDLGCGAGAGALSLAAAGARVIAIDEVAENVVATRDSADRRKVRVETHHGRLHELAFVRAESIDAAVSSYGLAAIADIDRVFRQVHRVLREDRPFVFSLPHPAFNMLDPADPVPRVRRAWWDDAPVPWSQSGPDARADQPRTLSGLFSSLARANFRIDALAEPPADEVGAGPSWCEALRWVPPTLVVRARKQGL
ncbi:MAG TPA: methyltransferase domain-containing protein [Acidimicrobiales bacterium]|nr:methyltransferase domain-containing protein [Acidimicrobiales bacterium]